MKSAFVLSAVLALCVTSVHAKDIRVALIYDKTGPLESYGIQTQRGMELGLEYATQGTMAVNGNKIVLMEHDARGKADVAKTSLASAYGDDNVDIAVGPTSSGQALAMLPLAEEYKKILLVEPATAEAITGDKWNRYIFRTARNSSQDASGAVAVLDKPDVYIGTLVQDYAFGRDGIKVFKEMLKNAQVVHEEYLPFDTTDFTAGAQRLFDALKDKPGRKIIYIKWAGVGNPYKIAELNPGRFGIEIAGDGNTHEAMAPYKNLPGLEGATYYYYGIPKNPVNDWLVSEHTKRFNTPPDYFTAGGMSAAIAIVEALKKTNGDPDTEKLISAMEGMEFDTPKGKMVFRKEDHQALQDMYHFRIKSDPAVAWGVPELVREIPASELTIPIRNKR